MSDSYIRLIPTDRDWQPKPAAAAAAAAYMAELLSGSRDDVERVENQFYRDADRCGHVRHPNHLFALRL